MVTLFLLLMKYIIEAGIVMGVLVIVFLCMLIIRNRHVATIVAAPVREPVKPVMIDVQATTTGKLQLAIHEQIWKQMELHLESTRLYTNPDISLDKLSAAIGYSKYHVSETLNSYAHKSFYQYINERRIHRAVELMQHMQAKELPVNISLIAQDCGFKAKSSFNQYFKKITGLTPTAYLHTASVNALSNHIA